MKDQKENKNDKIFTCWKKKWKSQQNDDEDIFYDMVAKTYAEFLEKSNKNREKNFSVKRLALIMVGLIALFEILAVIIIFFPVVDIFKIPFATLNSSDRIIFLGVLAASLTAIVTAYMKWIDVKKYQETWSRHSVGFHNMQAEMMRFCYDLNPYDEINELKKKKEFMNRMLKIWDDNYLLFQMNMETKEKNIIDSVKALYGNHKE